MTKDWTNVRQTVPTFYSHNWTTLVAWIIPLLLMFLICSEKNAAGQTFGSSKWQFDGQKVGGNQNSSRQKPAKRPSSFPARQTSFSSGSPLGPGRPSAGGPLRPLGENFAGNKPNNGKLFRPARVIAMVAGQPIFEADLLLQINEIIETRAADAPDSIKKQMLEKGIRELLPRMLEQKMMYHQAISGLPDPSKIGEIKEDLYKQMDTKQLPTILKQYQVNNLSQLDARLRSLGSSWRAMKEQLAEQEIAKFGVTSMINVDKEIGHSQLWNQYVKDRKDYQIEEQVRFEQLMVSFAKTPNRDEAWNRIAKMGDEVVYGARFIDVAKKNSDGFYASKGGQYSWTKRTDLTNKVLVKKIFSSPVGKLGDIFETDQGSHIIRVIERQEKGFVPFEEAQEKIREKILAERQSKAIKKVIKEIKSKVPYKILVEGVKF